MTRGYLCGKFMPATIGHARLIEFAMQRCDKLIVNIIVQPGEPFVNEAFRADPLRKFFKDYSKDKIEFIFSRVINRPKHLKHGEPDSSIWWGNWVKRSFGSFDYVFSSEKYGELFAQTIGAKNILCDIERNLTPISSTMCRNNPIRYNNYILPGAKHSSKIKICICGTESVGKTTLVKMLEKYFNTYAIYEHRSQYIKSVYNIVRDDLFNIQQDRDRQESDFNKIEIQNFKPFIFYDTDILTTSAYENYCLNTNNIIKLLSDKSSNVSLCDLYIYLDNDAPYIKDNENRFNEFDRNLLHNEMFNLHKQICDSNNIEFVKFSLNGSYTQRYIDILSYINEFLIKN